MPLEESICVVMSRLGDWLERGNLSLPPFDDIEDFIYLKNREKVVVYVNPSYCSFYRLGRFPIGLHGDAFLEKAIAKVANATDELLEEGYRAIEVDHIGSGSDGSLYMLRTHKRSLAEFNRPEFWVLGVTRPIAKIASQGSPSGKTLADYAELYHKLSAEEREMCRLYAMGETTRVIANAQTVSPRTIELRRQKVLEHFGFERPIEIVKLLVRLQSNGLIDIDV